MPMSKSVVPCRSNSRTSALTDAVTTLAQAAARKADAHLLDPRRFPLDPKRRSLEKHLVEAVQTAPAKLQSRLAARSATRARAATRVDGVDLASAVPVDLQLGMLAFDWKALIAWLMQSMNVAATPPTPPTAIQFVLHSMRCKDHTGDWGKDEIDLAASTKVHEVVGTAMKPVYDRDVPFARVGSFKGGQTIALGDRVLGSFPVNEGGFPKVLSTTIMLVEKDYGDQKWLMDLVKKAKDWTEGKVKEFVEGKVADPTLEKGAVVFVAAALDAVFGAIFKWLGDEVFEPVSVSLLLPSSEIVLPGGGRSTPVDTLRAFFRDGDKVKGEYELNYSWALV